MGELSASNSQHSTRSQKGKKRNERPYDMEERTLAFARDVRAFVKILPLTIANVEDIRQLVKASGSVGANYIEAVEAISKKDNLHRLKISRKEAKESRYWLRLVDCGDRDEVEDERASLVQESTELLRILSSLITKGS